MDTRKFTSRSVVERNFRYALFLLMLPTLELVNPGMGVCLPRDKVLVQDTISRQSGATTCFS